MIIINDKPGQLCNRLWSYAPFIAQCLKEKKTLVIPYFGDYSSLFNDLNCHRQIRFIYRHDKYYNKVISILFSFIRRLPTSALRRFNVYVDKTNWGNEQWTFETLFGHKAIIFLGAWNHPKYEGYLNVYHSELKRIFKPKENYVFKIESLFTEKRKVYDVIFGVHIRRRDYKEFMGGAYFFEDSVYVRYMEQLVNAKEFLGKKVGFLLCSDEALSIEPYNHLSSFTVPKAKNVEDLYALSLCDYMIGPPSTFSMWASFYGKVPLRILKYKTENIEVQQFSRIIALDKFENGSVLEHVPNNYSYMNRNNVELSGS